MAELLPDDLAEQIMIRLHVKDLIRCTRVCKSWHSFITSTRFINSHLNRNALRNRRILLADRLSSDCDEHLVGSSNGLVCIRSVTKGKVLVGNPLTREVRHLELPPIIGLPICWGFGYESSTDDYKIILGSWKGRRQKCRTLIQVFSLKSNYWKVIGKVKYKFNREDGVLINDTLHWIVEDQNDKKLIISYDLSKEEFKEIPQPDDARYESMNIRHLGIMKECLCIFPNYFSYQYNYMNHVWLIMNCVWLMKNYNVKESWELVPHDVENNYDTVTCLHSPGFFHDDDDGSWFSSTFDHNDNRKHYRYVSCYVSAPIYVKSLVSPHVYNKRSSS